jgi:DNA-binding GntR family transcriptional regulator
MSNISTLQNRAYSAVRGHLLNGKLSAVRKLSRRSLAVEYGVSEASMKWIFGRLEAEGLLESSPQSGTRIRSVSAEEFRQVSELRALIEGYAAERAAARINASDLAAMRKSCDVFAALLAEAEQSSGRWDTTAKSRPERALAAEHLFHGTLVRAGGNPTAARLVENLRVMGYVAYFSRFGSRETVIAAYRRTLTEHTAIVGALHRRDGAEAARLVREHVAHATEQISEQPATPD